MSFFNLKVNTVKWSPLLVRKLLLPAPKLCSLQIMLTSFPSFFQSIDLQQQSINQSIITDVSGCHSFSSFSWKLSHIKYSDFTCLEAKADIVAPYLTGDAYIFSWFILQLCHFRTEVNTNLKQGEPGSCFLLRVFVQRRVAPPYR